MYESSAAIRVANQRIRADETRARRRERRLREASKPEPWSARGALRRAGLAAPRLGRELADDAARGASFVAERQPFNLGAAGGMLIAFAAGLAGLIFVDLLLSERGSRATSRGLGATLRGIRAFADPSDPLFARTPREESPAGPVLPITRPVAPRRPGDPHADSPDVARGRGGSLFRPTSAAWGGAHSVAAAFASIAAAAGPLRVTSEKRETQRTASGGVSDHWVGSRSAYAYDLAGSVEQMDRAARALMRALGVSWDGGPIVFNRTRFGYRLQILYRTNVGGNHFDHIHIGVRRV
jgi:hypothetical protein